LATQRQDEPLRGEKRELYQQAPSSPKPFDFDVPFHFPFLSFCL
jgi:hypothetical protein